MFVFLIVKLFRVWKAVAEPQLAGNEPDSFVSSTGMPINSGNDPTLPHDSGNAPGTTWTQTILNEGKSAVTLISCGSDTKSSWSHFSL